MILDEIQPRDTNLYFKEATILQGPSALDLGSLGANLPSPEVPAGGKGSSIQEPSCNSWSELPNFAVIQGCGGEWHILERTKRFWGASLKHSAEGCQPHWS